MIFKSNLYDESSCDESYPCFATLNDGELDFILREEGMRVCVKSINC